MFLAMYKIFYTDEACRQINALPIKNKQQIKNAVERLSDDPRQGKMLRHELKGLWSYRIGTYRIVYKIYEKEIILMVLTVGHRKDVYLKMKRKRKYS
jgi:mRNA interferase RelE/StbE